VLEELYHEPTRRLYCGGVGVLVGCKGGGEEGDCVGAGVDVGTGVGVDVGAGVDHGVGDDVGAGVGHGVGVGTGVAVGAGVGVGVDITLVIIATLFAASHVAVPPKASDTALKGNISLLLTMR